MGLHFSVVLVNSGWWIRQCAVIPKGNAHTLGPPQTRTGHLAFNEMAWALASMLVTEGLSCGYRDCEDDDDFDVTEVRQVELAIVWTPGKVGGLDWTITAFKNNRWNRCQESLGRDEVLYEALNMARALSKTT